MSKYQLSAPDHSIPKSSGIYIINHAPSGKFYVGSAIKLFQRHGEHQRMLRRGVHENKHLQRVWNKYGATEFEFVVLLFCDAENLLFYEQRAIDAYRTRIGWRHLFNSNPNAGSRLGSKKTPEELAKLSARMKGNSYTKGRKLSAEHKAKISAWTRAHNLGRTMSEETKAKIGSANRGRIVTQETRVKISSAGKGKYAASDKQQAHLATWSRFKGHVHSAETRAKIAAKSKAAARRRRRKEGGQFINGKSL